MKTVIEECKKQIEICKYQKKVVSKMAKKDLELIALLDKQIKYWQYEVKQASKSEVF